MIRVKCQIHGLLYNKGIDKILQAVQYLIKVNLEETHESDNIHKIRIT